MRKLLTAMLTVIAVCCVTAGVACHSHTYSEEWSADATNHWHAATCGHEDEKSDTAAHTWVATDGTDDDGNTVYACSVCGYVHEHTYSTEWTSDRTGHWHAATCGHSDAKSGFDEHVFEDGACLYCGYDESKATLYTIAFSYYTDDDEDGEYGSEDDILRRVTYTAVEYNGLLVNIEGDELYLGEKFAFTVTKSVLTSYTDTHDYPLVLANDEVIDPDDNGWYIVTVEGDTIITVTNVEDDAYTIDGSGTQSDPYTINSLVDWLWFAYMINDKDWFASFNYNTAYWELKTDLDFEGESIYVIGDGYSSSYSWFCGNFNGNGHTIKNFALDNAVYDSEGEYSQYLGVFGILAGYEGVDTCVKNLNVENFTVTAGASASTSVYVGGLVGFISGASVINCSVDGCVITVAADSDYGAIVGGLTGICQSGYDEDSEVVYYSSIQYCSVNADISGTGYLYEAGGIAGRTYPASSNSPIFIFNCYSTGIYSDAAQTGGIVGYIGRYTSVQNCYSTADIIAQCSNTSAPETAYVGSPMDYRYAYAGGIVGYAENDTIITGCFYKDGAISAIADAGTDYAKTGDILAVACEAGFEDYRAQAAILSNNLTSSQTVTNDVLKNTLGWNAEDWVFGDSGYPTINQESAEISYTVTIKIGTETYTYTLENRYMPMAYWYLAEATTDGSGVDQYITAASADTSTVSTSHTYGYYFDAACTERVPEAYVPMGNVTLYAKYADYSEIAGTYYLNSNNISVTLVLNGDGTYTFTQNAIYLEGNFEYNGTYATLKDSYFARLVSSATSTQQETYFTFWAELDAATGDLKIYDCAEMFAVDSNYDSYGYTYLARLVSSSSPLVAVSAKNTGITGKYYVSGDTTRTYTFEIGYTGSAVVQGSTQSLTYSYDSNGNLTVVVNAVSYTATVVDGKITKLTSGANEINLVAYDDFEGTWEQSVTINKKYTFDGIKNWTYYVNGEEVSTGTYEVDDNGVLTFTRDPNGANVKVTVTLNSDGTLNVKESTGTVSVGYYFEGGYAGTWYTAAQQSNFYTMTLSGLGSDGIGLLNISGSGLSISDLRYIADTDGSLYAYSGDLVYAILTYSTTTGVMTVQLYSSSTGSLDTTLYFYLYDNFKGDWFTTINDGTNSIYKVTFNGLGAYDTETVREEDSYGSYVITSMAVNGTATIYYTDANGDAKTATADYTYSSTSGYTFTFNNVTYTMVYDENKNEVSLTYGTSGEAVLIAGDSLYNVTYVDGDGFTYAFNGGGSTANGGTVVITDGTTTYNYYYKIDGDYSFVIYSDSAMTVEFASAELAADGTSYTFKKSGSEESFKVDTGLAGTWAVYGGYVTFTVPEVYYFVDGTVIEVDVTYYVGSTTSSDNTYTLAGYYDGTTVWFNMNSTTYYINNVYGVMVLSTTYDPDDDDDQMELYAYDGYCATYETEGGDRVMLAGDSDNDEEYGNATVIIDGASTAYYYKVDANGNITIYTVDSAPVAVYTFNAAANGSYTNASDDTDTVKRELVAITTATDAE